jgi:hypothetical protein
MSEVTVTIHGLDAAQAKLRQVSRDLTGSSMISGMKNVTRIVLSTARAEVPKDTGKLMGSLVADTYLEGMTVVGTVGTPIKYGKFVELSSEPHFPPLHSIEGWAERHGKTAIGVARYIAAFGTKANPFLKRSFEANEARIEALIGKVVAEIVTK